MEDKDNTRESSDHSADTPPIMELAVTKRLLSKCHAPIETLASGHRDLMALNATIEAIEDQGYTEEDMMTCLRAKLHLLENALLAFAVNDIRVLPKYFPQYLGTLSNLCQLEDSSSDEQIDDSQKKHIMVFQQVLGIIDGRKSKLLVMEAIKAYFIQDGNPFPTQTLYGELYLPHAAEWLLQVYSTHELLENFISLHQVETKSAKAECHFIFQALSTQKRNNETNEFYLTRQAASVLILHEFFFGDENYNLEGAFLNLSHHEEEYGSHNQQSPSVESCNLAAWCRVAQLLDQLKRDPSVHFFHEVILSYLDYHSATHMNSATTSDQHHVNTQQLTLLKTLFINAITMNAKFLANLIVCFEPEELSNIANDYINVFSESAEDFLPVLERLFFALLRQPAVADILRAKLLEQGLWTTLFTRLVSDHLSANYAQSTKDTLKALPASQSSEELIKTLFERLFKAIEAKTLQLASARSTLNYIVFLQKTLTSTPAKRQNLQQLNALLYQFGNWCCTHYSAENDQLIEGMLTDIILLGAKPTAVFISNSISSNFFLALLEAKQFVLMYELLAQCYKPEDTKFRGTYSGKNLYFLALQNGANITFLKAMLTVFQLEIDSQELHSIRSVNPLGAEFIEEKMQSGNFTTPSPQKVSKQRATQILGQENRLTPLSRSSSSRTEVSRSATVVPGTGAQLNLGFDANIPPHHRGTRSKSADLTEVSSELNTTPTETANLG